jgi:AraC-like DNA-binding protein
MIHCVDRSRVGGRGILEMLSTDLPLRRHILFESTDADETRQRVGQVFCPHGLRLLRAAAAVEARQHFVALGRTSISYLAYGAPVAIAPDVLSTFYLVQLPLWGTARIRVGRREFTSTPQRASVINPTDALRMEWSAGCGQLIVRFERAFVESLAASLLGHRLRHGLSFHHELDWRVDSARRWLDFVLHIVQQIDAGFTANAHVLATRQIEQALLAWLLEAQPNDSSAALSQSCSGCTPRHVRKAVDFIEAHAAEPIGIQEIVAASDASARSLYEGFRRFRGTSPMELLRSLRIRRAREDLSQASAGTTVSEVATRWGFFQLGRFAAQYRQLCGETPSATLRRALASRD